MDQDQLDAGPGGKTPMAEQIPRLAGPGQQPISISRKDFESFEYNMSHQNRGLAIIINNKHFEKSTGMNKREGTDEDAVAMNSIFRMLGFEEIWLEHDLKVNEIRKVINKAAKINHTENDCFACVILTHGEEGYLFGTDGKMPLEDIVGPFKGDKCTSLAGKPKLFFIQACRGRRLDEGVTMADAIGDKAESDEVELRRIPTEADFLMAYSVVPGYYAWRNSSKGSWFVQALVEIFKQYWQKLDLLTMMTRVSRMVAFDFESKSNQAHMCQKKQIPCITSMLTKEVYFKQH